MSKKEKVKVEVEEINNPFYLSESLNLVDIKLRINKLIKHFGKHVVIVFDAGPNNICETIKIPLKQSGRQRI